MSNRESPQGNGYIKIYRKLLTSAVFQSDNLLQVWIWCLLRANWHDTPCIFGGKQLLLKRGQFITGRYTGSKECRMKPGTFYGQLRKLAEFGNIVLKSDNKKTLIIIVNYEGYQDDQQQPNTKPTPSQHQANTDKEVKKLRSEEKEYARPKCAEDVENYIRERQPQSTTKWIATEALKFFDHFESNGWKVSGKTPMVDWRAAVRNWLRNAEVFSKSPAPQAIKPKLGDTPSKEFKIACSDCGTEHLANKQCPKCQLQPTPWDSKGVRQ